MGRPMARASSAASSCEEPRSSSGRQYDARVTVALQLLQNQSSLCVEQAAKTVNLSGSRLRHLLREAVGVPLHRYLKHGRLLRAKELVENTYLTIKEITSAAGFADLSHFLRDYKTAFGETPSETRHRRS